MTPEETGWRRMDSAPRDGSPVDLWVRGSLDPTYQWREIDATYVGRPDAGSLTWRVGDDFDESKWFTDDEVLAWRPVPGKPEWL